MKTKYIALSLLVVASLLAGCGKQAEQEKKANAVYEQLPQKNDSVKTPDDQKKSSASSIYDQLPKDNKSVK